jgi:ribosome-associated toxin RatA of RatAB toxin-antitoxin module/CRP-like cAMP-binding protein
MQVRKTVLMPYPAESMFDIIEQAEHYPQFIPWCSGAEILERNDEFVAARVSMRVAGLQLALETRNPKRRPEWLQLKMMRGPLRRFEGEWRLTPLNAWACRIDFTLTYEIGDGMIERVAGPVFARMADSMVDAYVTRAERILPRVEKTPQRAAATRETEMTDATLLDALRKSKLAAELTDAQSRKLAAVMTVHELKDGELLVHEGAPDNHLYVIDSGVLAVVKGAGGPDRVTLNTLSPGELAGEMSWLDGAERYASLIASGATRVLGLEREKLESLAQTDGEIVYRVMRAIIRVVHTIQRRLWMQQSELTNYIFKQHGRY